jgi:hypothetical protein
MGVWWRWVVKGRVVANRSLIDACIWWKRPVRGRVAANRSLIREGGRWNGVGGRLRSAGHEYSIWIVDVF